MSHDQMFLFMMGQKLSQVITVLYNWSKVITQPNINFILIDSLLFQYNHLILYSESRKFFDAFYYIKEIKYLMIYIQGVHKTKVNY